MVNFPKTISAKNVLIDDFTMETSLVKDAMIFFMDGKITSTFVIKTINLNSNALGDGVNGNTPSLFTLSGDTNS